MATTFKMDTREFDATMRRYRELSRKDPAIICNTKAFFIARGATRLTPKADKEKIKKELGAIVQRGKTKGALKLVSARDYDAPLVALIINAQRGKGKGLYGVEMTEAIRKFIANRMRSIAFLKSGWLPAIKGLAALVPNKRNAPPIDRSAKQFGEAKGSFRPARDSSWKTVSTIINSAGANENNKGALIRYGGPALQQAVNDEEASMREYVERKLRETAKAAGVRTN